MASVDKTNTQQAQSTPEYEAPKVSDYGTLSDLTLGGHLSNGDVPGGVSNAYS